MRYVELFAGGGGLSLGLDRAGWQCVAHAEIEPHARAILRQHWPDTPLFGDVSQIDGTQWRGLVDVISGGSPCQDMSVAGKRAGLEGARSSLFHQQVRIWQESNAPYLLWENVPGAFSSNNGYDFAAVLSALVGRDLVADGAVRPDKHGKLKWLRAGRATGPQAVVCWRVLDLQYFGPPQRRARIFIVAARPGARDPREILLEREGVCRHPAPSRQARQGIAANAQVGAVAINNDRRGSVDDVAYALRAGHRQQQSIAFHHPQHPIHGAVSPAISRSTDGMGEVQCATGDITHALTHEGADASEDGTGRGTPIVVGNSGMESWRLRDEAITLTARDAKGPNNVVVGALDFGGHGGSYNGQDAHQGRIRAEAGRPRRLTPRECERLMGWADDWTLRGVREDGTVYTLSDTARYRIVGNGVGSPCAEWIARGFA